MTTLNDLIKQYGSRTENLAAGDKVLFERGDDFVGCSINLGEVTEIKPQSDFTEPTVRVRGIHTFLEDGSNKPFRGRTQWAFPLSQLMKPISERLAAHAQRWEKQAAQTRAWITSLEQ